jgi:hypothetical protein
MISLTQKQIEALYKKAKTETDRNIYTIRFDGQEIIINGDWSIERNGKPINESIVSAIEAYCTKDNIMWEYNSTYSVWCD